MKIFRILKHLSKIERIILISVAGLLVVGVTTVILLSVKPEKKPDSSKESSKQEKPIELPTPDKEDPLSIVVEEQEEESGAEVDIEEILEKTPQQEYTGELSYGIDVSKYQGAINWKQVAESGIEFAMIRVGYRTLVGGEIMEDPYAKDNLKGAQEAGIKVGAYFFSTAVSTKEAEEEANWIADIIDEYQITYPVAYDCEGFERSGNRQYGMSIKDRTDTAVAFLNRIIERGYSPLFYGSKSDMEDELQWDMERISSLYKVWVAQYPAKPYPETKYSSYSGAHVMWQYTSKGTVPGIRAKVDMNVAYFKFKDAQPPKEEGAPEDTTPNVEAGMNFTTVEEIVTAKEKTNLRDKPSQGTDSKVMHTLLNGEQVTRTGVSNSGWSRVVYNGNTYYAVTSLLTTDLTYKPPHQEPDDGIKTEFEPVNEMITPKEATNLRTLPSVENPDSKVVIKLNKGETVQRTGINKELGWSRVVWQGQTLYCVSQYMVLVE